MRWKVRIVISVLVFSFGFPALALDKAAVEKQFHGWLENEIWPEAAKQQISRNVFDAAFKGVSLNWKLPDLVPPSAKPPSKRKQSQAEFSSPRPYFDEKRLRNLAAIGRKHYDANKRLLDRIEQIYGVPGRIIIAIWGRESGYGAAAIPYPAMHVLATKAFMSTRKDMFRGELIAGLHILQGGDTTPANMKGSWAGALGQPQFLPTSFLQYAVDFDGDNKRDIWNSKADIFASIANYLAKKGWQRGRDWGYEASIPGDVSCALEGPDQAVPISGWAGKGITRISGKAFPNSELSAPGMMLVPAGRSGPEFIVTPNFYVIKEYNNSDLYALFIGNLADRIAYGSGAFQGAWGNVGHMLRSNVLKMQQVLVREGHDVGKVDGLPGYKTRRSIGRWQEAHGMKPTCFPTEMLLKQIN